jgi:serine/threonine-protein kinase
MANFMSGLNDLPADVLRHVNALCLRFEHACQKAPPWPRLEDFLTDEEGPARTALLRELLLLEVHYRRAAGESVRLADYQQRFPGHDDFLQAVAAPAPNTVPGPGAANTPLPSPDGGVAPAETGPPLPASASVLKALGAVLPQVPRVQLRDPHSGAASPTVRPRSEEQMPPPEPAGRYQLLGEIARGGMGAVLKGRDTDLGRDIAVKVLLQTHQGKTELLQRFVEEAQISGQLQHPGIVPVYELGQFADARPYFTMKLVKGQTLAKLLEERKDPRQSQPQLLKVFEQVCQTLAYAHARGVIHRDLKPSNVMVGAFGEVQVMDWGLAKVLAESGVADENRTQLRPEVSVIRTRRSEGSEAPGGSGSQTQAGSILGTPAYMAPEQARGDLELVDERADVFGLGAILCEILTGRPPFTGKPAEAHRKAQTGRLEEAFGWLDGCGADAELVALAKHCLAAEPFDRPRNAGAVTAAVDAYQQSVTDRLRQAELERAAAEARAEEEKNTRQMAEAKAAEERKRRRATLALAAAVLALVVFGGGAAAWWWQQRAALVRDVEAALAEADAHQQAGRRPEVRVALERAEGRLGGGGPQGLRERVRLARRDADMVADLDNIRLRLAELSFDFALAEQRYAATFAGYGLAVAELPAAEAAARLRGSAVREALLAALDDWRWLRQRSGGLGFEHAVADFTIVSIAPGGAIAEDGRLKVGDRIIGVGQGLEGPLVDMRGKGVEEFTRLVRGRLGSVVRLEVVPAGGQESRVVALTRGGQTGVWLEEVVGAADDNAWRQEFRKAMAGRDAAKMKALARQPEALAQPPIVLDWLGIALGAAGLVEEALGFMRQAQRRHPGDFWLNYHLGELLTRHVYPAPPDEAVGYFRAAVAIRPVAAAHDGLGNALKETGDLEGAIGEYREALSLDLESANLHHNLGNALATKGDVDGAIVEYRQAIALDPKHAASHSSLGGALYFRGDADGALAELRQAITLDPKWVPAHAYLGNILKDKGDLDGALAEFRQAIALKPKYAMGHNNVAWALATWPDPRRRDPAQAVAAAKKAVELEPQKGDWWNTLGVAHYRNGDPKAAIEALEKSMASRHGGDAYDWFFLAMARWQLGDKDAARKWYQQADAWKKKYQPHNPELRRFRAEATALLGLPVPEAAPKAGDK